MESHSAVSLFSNCGAGDVGYAAAGFRFEVFAELLAQRLEVAKRNHRDACGVRGDLRETWPRVIEAWRGMRGRERPSLLSACPPCQGISSANHDRGAQDDPDAGGRDPRNLLVVPIVKVALELEPRVIVIENVASFLTRLVPHPDDGEPVSAAALVLSLLDKWYLGFPLLTDLADYGVPQRRVRAFLTFVHRDEPGLDRLLSRRRGPFPRPTHAPESGGAAPVTLRAALAELAPPPLDGRDAGSARATDFHPLHVVSVFKPQHYRMVEAVPADSGASAWENEECPACGRTEIAPELAECPECSEVLLRPVTQTPSGGYRLIHGWSSSYRRMHPDRPAATITTASGYIGGSSTLHPSQNRVLSVLECAHLQTLPTDFDWGFRDGTGPGLSRIRRMIGEAVPPRFTEQHGRVIRGLLEQRTRAPAISLLDPRCVDARDRLGLPEPHAQNVADSGVA